MRLLAAALVLADLAAAWSPATADDKVYRWVDKNGRVHNGDRPPANATPMMVRAIPVPLEPSAIARLRVEAAMASTWRGLTIASRDRSKCC